MKWIRQSNLPLSDETESNQSISIVNACKINLIYGRQAKKIESNPQISIQTDK